jgi:hypothetical protein
MERALVSVKLPDASVVVLASVPRAETVAPAIGEPVRWSATVP